MAAGPFLGAAILDAVRPEAALTHVGLLGLLAADFLVPAWRYVFYINVPIGIVALAFGWAATVGWDTPRSRGRVDVLGALLFTGALAAILLGVTLLGEQAGETVGAGPDPATVSLILVATGSSPASPPSPPVCAGPTRSSTRASSPTGSSRRRRS